MQHCSDLLWSIIWFISLLLMLSAQILCHMYAPLLPYSLCLFQQPNSEPTTALQSTLVTPAHHNTERWWRICQLFKSRMITKHNISIVEFTSQKWWRDRVTISLESLFLLIIKLLTAELNSLQNVMKWWTIETLTANQNQFCFNKLEHLKLRTTKQQCDYNKQSVIALNVDTNIVIVTGIIWSNVRFDDMWFSWRLPRCEYLDSPTALMITAYEWSFKKMYEKL